VNREEKCDEALASGTAEYPVIQQPDHGFKVAIVPFQLRVQVGLEIGHQKRGWHALATDIRHAHRHALILEGHGVVVIATHVVVGTVPRRK